MAKNNFKGDFFQYLDFLHPQIPDFQILSKPYINGNIIYSAFRCINLNLEKLTLLTGFVLQRHIYYSHWFIKHFIPQTVKYNF